MAKRTYTPDEYQEQSQFVDFYNMGGIDVAVSAHCSEVHEDEDRRTRPSECFDACVGTAVNLRVCLVRFLLRGIRVNSLGLKITSIT